MNAWADNPQAAEIDAVIERAGRLAPAEVKALHVAADRDAAWNAACDAAWEATWVAAWNAGRDAARDAACDAAWDAAWNAAQEAARDAARDAARAAAWTASALVLRDLIDEPTAWNQAAYDALTGPWRTVIGPIHPADEVLR